MMNDPLVSKNMELLKLLWEDWSSCLESIEKQVLKLEVQFHDQKLIDDLLEKIHRIKRGSSFIGMTVITRVVHEIEVALHTIREKEIAVTSVLIDLLLSAVGALNDCLRQFSDPFSEQGRLQEGDAFTEWNDLMNNLHDFVENNQRKTLNKSVHESEETEIVPFEKQNKTKEQLLFEIYDHLDRMINECFIQLDQEANNRNALHALLLTVHRIRECIAEIQATLSTDNICFMSLNELVEVLEPFENLIATIGEKQQPFTKDDLNLGYEIADYVKSILESVALEKEVASENTTIVEKINHARACLASVLEPNTESGNPFPVSGKDPIVEPVPRAVLPQSIRVSQDKLDKMMNMISELLIAKNTFMHLSAKLNMEHDLPELSKEVKELGFSVNRISDELQNTIMSIRMVEVKTVFQKMPRIIRDVAQLTGKKMELVMVGETTEIDKTIVEQISDPLVHLIRNAADHGIENKEDRLHKGKRETGQITLRAYNKDKHVYIEIEDDGKGIDPAVLKQKAIERGFITPENADKMTKSQLINLIFMPGFSTAGQLTELSGRGVGMDIVKNNIEKINGSIAIDSEMDKGTKVVIRLPLTLAISRGLVVDVSKESYIIPIDYISKTEKIDRKNIHSFNGKYFAVLNGEVIGIEWLSKLFLLGERDLDQQEQFNAVIISNGEEKLGMIVDKLRNEQEFVIKTFTGHLAGTPGISGSTLLGNGQVVLILNPIDLIQLAKNGDLQEAI